VSELPQNWAGKRVSVLGLARSGLALARALTRLGAHVLLSDQRPGSELTAAIAEAELAGAKVEVGGHTPALLECDVLVISPGVSLYSDTVQEALRRGVAVAGEVEIAFQLCPRPILAVTGTNGKSTTCSLLQAALGERSRLAGNIGIPLVAEVTGDLAGVDFVVAEISSFQLETTHTFAPRLGLLTNVTADHLDRHRTMEEYVQAKSRLFAYQGGDDIAIFNADDPWAEAVAQRVESGSLETWPYYPTPRTQPREVWRYSVEHPVELGAWFADGKFYCKLPGMQAARPVLRWDFPDLPGPHNLSNGLAACLAALAVGATDLQIDTAFRTYRRMHHRMEQVGELTGVRFVDDSKATNVSSVESALLTYKDPVVLIAGGRDKGLDLPALGKIIAGHCHGLVAIGEAGPIIADQAERHGLTRVQKAESMDDAVARAYALAEGNGVVLLSPACTSFDMFRNAEHRGDEFAASVRRLIEQSVQGAAKEER
jgi:UDP-N-acetylmuramoylalanine--D-glutamate ligase